MAEISYFWGGSTIGDALAFAPIDEPKFSNFLFRLMSGGDSYLQITLSPDAFTPKINDSVISGYLNELVPSWSGGQLLVGSGAAIVDGHLYTNDNGVYTAMSAPVAGSYYYMGGLLSDPTAQTVRIAKIGPETTPGALVQPTTHGGQYFMPLACVRRDAGGAATLYDVRRFVHANGHKVPFFLKRQGGDATLWTTPGANNYDIIEQVGFLFLSYKGTNGTVTYVDHSGIYGSDPATDTRNVFLSDRLLCFATRSDTTTPKETFGDNGYQLVAATYDVSSLTNPGWSIVVLGQICEYLYDSAFLNNPGI